MNDMRSRLREVERIEPPELWQEILVREPGALPESRSRARVLLAVAVAVVVLAAGVLVPLTLLRLGPLAHPSGSGHRTMTITYPSEAMEPTIHVGQILVIDLDAYRTSSSARGDVVAFRYQGQLVVKRVIGLPGEIVEERQGQVLVNGKLLDEPYVRPDAKKVSLGPWTVPAGHVFVMGDNRPNSNDSRYAMGQIAVRDLVGKVLVGATASSAPPPPSAPAVSQDLVLPTQGPVERLVAGGGAIYSIYARYPQAVSSVQDVVVRLDVRTGEVIQSAPLVQLADLQMAGGWLWVTGTPGPRAPGIYRLDPRTLKLHESSTVPHGGVLAPSPSGLWVGRADQLDLIDADGRYLRHVTTDGQIAALAMDPSGRVLYVATSVPGDATPRSITERDASTGAVRATLQGFPAAAVTVTELSATIDGVWVSYSGGLLGHVVFLRASDLRQVASFTPGHEESGTNSIHANVAAGVLWVADDMTGSLWCSDPATGARRALLAAPPTNGYGFTDVVSVGSDLYVGTGKGVYRVTPDPRCVAVP